MPSRNVIKIDAPESYYHVYARGASRQKIFCDPEDYACITRLLARYLSRQCRHNFTGIPYPHFYDKTELLCYCLMPNHIHLFIYQKEASSMSGLMRALLNSYVHYFNQKYERSGALMESRYKASMILNDAYLLHISRYIHLNPRQWQSYAYSSLPYYLGQPSPEWLRPERISRLFGAPTDYLQFLKNYTAEKQAQDDWKHLLADDTTPYF